MVSKNTLVDQRPFYFSHIAVDPKNPDRVYGVSEALSVSKDGGKTFKEIADPVHVDYHAIWIAPNDPTRIIVGEDGGYALTRSTRAKRLSLLPRRTCRSRWKSIASDWATTIPTPGVWTPAYRTTARGAVRPTRSIRPAYKTRLGYRP